MRAATQRLKFGDFELDLRSGELWRSGARIVLPNQPFRILTVLINQRGNLVTRDELRRELWPEETFVDFEHSLNAGIRRLREAIGDSAAAPQFIETIPQRGYRFIADVEESSAMLCEENATTVPLQEGFGPGGIGTHLRSRLSNWPVISVAALIVLIAIVFALVGSRGRPSTADVTHRSLIRLTSTSGVNADPALSPDGTLLAYASDRGGGADFDIYVQAVVGGDPVRLTNDPAEESEPSFAPDGAHIVFSKRGAGLYVVGALGGEPRLIVRTPWARTPKFSPDGRWISYWTGFPASVVAGGIPGALGSIFIVPSDGGSPREIVTHLASARYPIWSPDGEHILFLGEENADQKTHDWYIIPKDGGRAIKTGTVQALRAAGLDTPFPIPGAWSARDNALVFASNETDSSNIWQIPIAPATRRVSGVPERLTFGTAIERNPIIANSGRIAFASIVEKVDIWRVPLDARTGVAAGPLERVTDDAANDRLPSFSRRKPSPTRSGSRTSKQV
jgi:Tol biopolymer transport system component/DNA-binding winged helix-turn-helix (wHTH) protein